MHLAHQPNILKRLETLHADRDDAATVHRMLMLKFEQDEVELLGSYPVQCPECRNHAPLCHFELIRPTYRHESWNGKGSPHTPHVIRDSQLRCLCGHRFKITDANEQELVTVLERCGERRKCFHGIYYEEDGILRRIDTE